MEPERRIEKLLRAFAKKRREQAPESMELHSAMRQQLHREVARRAEGRAGGSFFAKLFPGGHPRLGFAVGIVAVIAVLGFFLLPLLTETKTRSMSMSSLDIGKAPPMEVAPPSAAPAPTIAPPPPAPVPAAPTIALKDKQKEMADDVPKHAGTSIEAAGEIRPAEVKKDIVTQTNLAPEFAAVSTPPSGTQMLPFKTEGATHSIGGGAALNRAAPTQPTPVEAPVMSVNASAAPSKLAANEKEKSPALQTASASVVADSATFYRLANSEAAAPATTQQFRRLNLPANSPRAAGASPAPVLATFRMEQNGNQLRVVDGDGSVYTGTVQIARDALPYGVVAADAQNKPVAAEDRSRASSAISNYFFRVAGTNRNLKQNIVFTGNFIPLTNTAGHRGFGGFGGGIAASRSAAEPTGGARPAAQEPAAPPQVSPVPSELPVSLLNARISGKVTIGDQKEIEVNAAPTK